MPFQVTDAGVVVDVDADVDPLMARLNSLDLGKQGAKAGKEFTDGLSKGAVAEFRRFQTTFNRTTSSVTSSARTMSRGVARESSAIIKALQGITDATSVIAAGVRHQTELVVRASKEQNNALTQSTNERLRLGKSENAQAVVQIQQQTAAARSAASARLQSARFMYETLGRLEKGFGAAVSGTARTLTSAIGRTFSGIGRGASSSVSSFTSIFRRSDTEISRSLSSSMSSRESILRSSFSRQERLLSSSVSRQTTQLQKLNATASKGVIGAATGRGAGVGLGGIAAGGGLIGLLTSGFSRFSDLERINKQFLALTGSIEDTNMLLAQVKTFAKDTPFDLVGVADLAKGFLAIGTDAKDVLPQVRAIADAVALTGGGVDELNRIQRAIGQVVSTGKLQGDELNQLAENLPGLNIRKLLAEQLTGGDVSALVEMQAAGDISGDAFVSGLIKGLQQDQRLVGASEDLAKTLGGRVANLKESFADFGASLIGLIAEPLKVAVLGAQTVLQGMSDFIKGEGLGPALETLRTALFGAAAGLSAVFAAKGAVEVFRLLVASVTLLTTPMGLLLATAGLLGAAINVLRRDLPAVDQFFGSLKQSIGDLAAGPLDRVRSFVGDIVGFFTSPKTAAAAAAGGDAIGRQISTGVSASLDARSPFAWFVQEKVIPAFKAAVEYTQTTVVPALQNVGRIAIETFGKAESAVVGFLRRVQPVLQPAIDGFRDLGSALGAGGIATVAAGLAGLAIGGPVVGAALAGITLVGTKLAGIFTGDFGAIRGGAGSAASGIGTVVSNLAGTIKDKLLPVADSIGDFLGNIFTGANLKKFEGGFLKVVERVGFLLGNLITNPKVVAAAGLIAAGAVVIGAKFVEGFAKGVIDNIPDLFRGASALIAKALFNPKVLGLAVAGAFALRTLSGLFRTAGQTSAASFGDGFKSKLSSAPGFVRGFTGNTSQFGDLTKTAAQATQLQNQLRILGAPRKVSLDVTDMSKARDEVQKLTDGLSKGELAGLRFRDQVTAAMSAVSAVFRGGRGVLSGLKDVGAAFTNAGRTAASSFGASLQNGVNGVIRSGLAGSAVAGTLTTIGKESGTKYGDGFVASIRAAGTNIRTSITDTLGRLREIASSQGTTIGAALGSALKTGATTALAGLSGFIAGKAEGSAGGSGALSAVGIGLATGLATANPIIGAAAGGMALLGAAIGRAGKEAQDARDRVSALSTSIGTELKSAIADGTITLAEFRKGLDFGDVAGFDAVQTAFEGLGPEAKKFLNTIDAGFNTTLLPTLKASKGDVTALKTSIVEAAKEAGLFTETFSDSSSDTLSVERQYDAFFKFITSGYKDLSGTQIEFLESKGATGLRDTLKDIGKIQGDINKAFEDATVNAQLFGAAPAVADQAKRAQDLAESLGLSVGAYGRLNAEIDRGAGSEPLQPVINDLESIPTLAATATSAINNLLNPTTAGTVANSILSLQDTFKDLKLGGDFIDQAKLTTAFEQVRTELSTVVQQGINDGSIFDTSTLENITAPLLASLLQGVDDPALRQAIIDQFTGIQATIEVSPEFKALGDVTDSVSRQQAIKGSGVTVPVEKLDFGSLDISQQKVAMANIGHDLMAGLASGITANGSLATSAVSGVVGKVVTLSKAQLKISSPSKVFTEIGHQIGAGMAIGLDDSIKIVGDAAGGLVKAVISPSHNPGVLGDGIGRDIGQGIADGLADSEADISAVISSALDAAVATATGTGSRLGDALQSAVTQFFGKVTGTDALTKGPGSTFSLTDAVAKITTGRNGILGTFDSNAQKLFDINQRGVDTDPETAPLSNAERDIFGENLFSLDVKDVLGASNIAAFSSALDDIANLGDVLLAQGRPAQEVSNTLQAYVDDLLATASALGFNSDQLLGLVDTLGLSDAALAQFVSEVNDLGTASANTTVTPPVPTSAELQALARPIVNNIYLPSGDPHAAALTVANAQAYAGSLPGG